MRMGLRAAAATWSWATKAACWVGMSGLSSVVVVEADFADGDAAGIGGEGRLVWRGLPGWLCAASWGWMPALAKMRGRLGELVGFGDLEGMMHLVGAVAYADGEDGGDAGGVGSGEDGGEFFGGIHVEMGVGVDEVHVGFRVTSVGEGEADTGCARP